MEYKNFCVILWIAIVTLLLQNKLVTGNESVVISTDKIIAKQGTSKNFTCSYTTRFPSDEVARLAWAYSRDAGSQAAVIAYYFKGNPLPTYLSGYDFSGYHMTIDKIAPGKGSSVLTIDSLDYKRHEGRYYCDILIYAYPSFFATYDTEIIVTSNNITLYINDNEVEDSTHAIDINEEQTFMVIVQGTKPAVEIIWTLEGNILNGTQENSPNLADNRLIDSINTLGPIRVTETSTLTCNVTNPGDSGVEKQIQLVPNVVTPTETGPTDPGPSGLGVKVCVTKWLVVFGIMATMYNSLLPT